MTLDSSLPSPNAESSSGAKKRAAIYLRVSTRDGEQTEENQRQQLRDFLNREGYELTGEFVDHESGRKGRRERSGFDAMFEAAENREFDTLVFWSLDRFSREGIRKTIHYLQQLESIGVQFRSYKEPYLNTENELVSHILLAVISYFAEYEAKKISRWTKAGLERAQQEGKDIGRPPQVRPVQGPAQGNAGGWVFEGGNETPYRPRIQHSQEVSEAYSRR